MAFVKNEIKSLIDVLNKYSGRRVWRTKQDVSSEDGRFEKGTAVLIRHASYGFREGQIHMLVTELNSNEFTYHGVDVDAQKFDDIFEIDSVLTGLYDTVETVSCAWENKRGIYKAMGCGGFAYAFVVFLMMSRIANPLFTILFAVFLTIGICGVVMYIIFKEKYNDSIRKIEEQIKQTL